MSKFKGKRMVEEDLIKKLQDLDPSGGTEYTAGTGIEISDENVISVDTDTIATKAELPDDVSGTNDGTNWTSLTIGEDTYAIPAGGGSSYTAGTGIDITNGIISVDNTIATKSELFSGDYDDLTNKPDLSVYAETADLATVATTGAYSDLTGTPTIPTKTSDLTNDSGFITSSDLPTNHVTTDTNQDITGVKTFVGAKRIKFKQSTSSDKLGFTCYDDTNGEKAFLELNPTEDALYLGRYGASRIANIGFKTGISGASHKLLVPNVTLSGNVTDYIPISVNNTKADSAGNISISVPTTATSTSTVTPTTETLTFTYSDNTTGTITFITAATVSTTTTLS